MAVRHNARRFELGEGPVDRGGIKADQLLVHLVCRQSILRAMEHVKQRPFCCRKSTAIFTETRDCVVDRPWMIPRRAGRNRHSLLLMRYPGDWRLRVDRFSPRTVAEHYSQLRATAGSGANCFAEMPRWDCYEDSAYQLRPACM